MEPQAPFGDISNYSASMMSPETPAGKPGASSSGGARGLGDAMRKHSPWTAARDKKKTKNVMVSDEDDPMPACFSSPDSTIKAGSFIGADDPLLSALCAVALQTPGPAAQQAPPPPPQQRAQPPQPQPQPQPRAPAPRQPPPLQQPGAAAGAAGAPGSPPARDRHHRACDARPSAPFVEHGGPHPLVDSPSHRQLAEWQRDPEEEGAPQQQRQQPRPGGGGAFSFGPLPLGPAAPGMPSGCCAAGAAGSASGASSGGSSGRASGEGAACGAAAAGAAAGAARPFGGGALFRSSSADAPASPPQLSPAFGTGSGPPPLARRSAPFAAAVGAASRALLDEIGAPPRGLRAAASDGEGAGSPCGAWAAGGGPPGRRRSVPVGGRRRQLSARRGSWGTEDARNSGPGRLAMSTGALPSHAGAAAPIPAPLPAAPAGPAAGAAPGAPQPQLACSWPPPAPPAGAGERGRHLSEVGGGGAAAAAAGAGASCFASASAPQLGLRRRGSLRRAARAAGSGGALRGSGGGGFGLAAVLGGGQAGRAQSMEELGLVDGTGDSPGGWGAAWGAACGPGSGAAAAAAACAGAQPHSTEWFEAEMALAVDDEDLCLQRAQHLLADLRARGVPPSPPLLRSYLQCCFYGGGDPGEAERDAREMCAAGGFEAGSGAEKLLSAIELAWQQLHAGDGLWAGGAL